MRKYLLVLLCFFSFCIRADILTKTASASSVRESDGRYSVNIRIDIDPVYELLSCSVSADVEITSNIDYTANIGKVRTSRWPYNVVAYTGKVSGTVTYTYTYATCPDTSACTKVTCQICGEFYCSAHETHTGCSAEDHADGDHTFNPCPKCGEVCMTCSPEHLAPCECGQMVYGCDKEHECSADCGHDNACPKCGEVCLTCHPDHVGPCEDCGQQVYGCETNHKCHEGEYGHPLQKCPKCDVCTTCDPSHGLTCEHCSQYFYACESHNSIQEECPICHVVYWSCVGHDTTGLCPTCHGNSFCGVNGCKVCMECNPDHIHEGGEAECPTCGGTSFCSKCGKCTNCFPNHCNNEGNSCNHNKLCPSCGKVCLTCNPSHDSSTCMSTTPKPGTGAGTGEGGVGCSCGNYIPCTQKDGCTRCMNCDPHVHVSGSGNSCNHGNLCPKCGKVCMTCNPQHKCGSTGSGEEEDPEEEDYPDLEIPESPELELPTSEALALLLEKLSPPSFTTSGGSSGSDVTVVGGGVNYPKWEFTISGKDFGFDDFEIPFTIDCGKFAEEPLSLIPTLTKAASVVLFAYIFIMAVIRSLRQW